MTTPANSSGNTVPADVPLLGRPPLPVGVSRIAVLYDAAAGTVGHPWDAARVREQVAILMTDAAMQFDYFPVRFAGSDAAAGIAAAFARIASELTAPDLVLVVGGPAVTADIAVIHRVLAPCILATPVPVFTALGADDAETILGDTASRVFPGAHAMLEAVGAIARGGRAPVEELRQRIQSLSRFLLAQQAAESRIMMQAMLMPALRLQMQGQRQQIRQVNGFLHAATQYLRLRLIREEAMLEQLRARIGIELARLAQQQASVALDAASVARMRYLRIGMLCGFACLIAVLWWRTTPASTVFFSGCALVVGSAIYVALSNRIIDSSSAAIVDSQAMAAPPAPVPRRSIVAREPLFQAVVGTAEEPPAAGTCIQKKEFPHE